MIKAKSHILANGSHFDAGQVVTGLSEAQEKQLVDAGSAEYTGEKSAPVVATPATPAKPVANEAPDKSWTKVKLLGHARKLGLIVEDTMTKAEIVKIIESNPQASEPAEDEGAEEKTPAVTHLPENAPTVVPQAKDGGADDEQE